MCRLIRVYTIWMRWPRSFSKYLTYCKILDWPEPEQFHTLFQTILWFIRVWKLHDRGWHFILFLQRFQMVFFLCRRFQRFIVSVSKLSKIYCFCVEAFKDLLFLCRRFQMVILSVSTLSNGYSFCVDAFKWLFFLCRRFQMVILSVSTLSNGYSFCVDAFKDLFFLCRRFQRFILSGS